MIESKKEVTIILTAFLLTLFCGVLVLGQVDATTITDSSIESDAVNQVSESAQMTLSDAAAEFELYRDRILDIFNMTMDNYNALNEIDTDRLHTYVFALWGYENGSLTLDEATEIDPRRKEIPSTKGIL